MDFSLASYLVDPFFITDLGQLPPELAVEAIAVAVPPAIVQKVDRSSPAEHTECKAVRETGAWVAVTPVALGSEVGEAAVRGGRAEAVRGSPARQPPSAVARLCGGGLVGGRGRNGGKPAGAESGQVMFCFSVNSSQVKSSQVKSSQRHVASQRTYRVLSTRAPTSRENDVLIQY